jgi:hypothetical protein
MSKRKRKLGKPQVETPEKKAQKPAEKSPPAADESWLKPWEGDENFFAFIGGIRMPGERGKK